MTTRQQRDRVAKEALDDNPSVIVNYFAMLPQML
jgi:hypothetical protein